MNDPSLPPTFQIPSKFRRGGVRCVLAIALCMSVTSVQHAAAADQKMCVPCDTLREQLRIASSKSTTLSEGIQMLRKAKAELKGDSNATNAFGSAYLVLQSMNVSFGLATVSCPIPSSWLRAALGGSAGVAELIQGTGKEGASLAAIVAASGAGVANDIRSLAEFTQTLRSAQAEANTLGKRIDSTIARFSKAKSSLSQEIATLRIHLSDGGCEQETLLDLLGYPSESRTRSKTQGY